MGHRTGQQASLCLRLGPEERYKGPTHSKILNIKANSGNRTDASISEKMVATIKTFSMLQGLSSLPNTFF